MLQLTGNIYDVTSKNVTDPQTGVITRVYTAEIIHKSNGKTEVTPLKLDAAVADAWGKAKGRDMVVEVRAYAMKTREGGILQGLTLADKRCLPGLLRVAPVAAAA
jgi:hypothetical protein